MATGRRKFLTQTFTTGISTACGAGAFSTVRAQDKPKAAPKEVIWHDVSEWGVEGQGWGADELTRRYDRLPAKAEKIVREPVWRLSHQSAGLMTHFQTDAPEIKVRYELLSKSLAMAHMPATGVSGVDLYALDADRKWRWASVLRPKGSAAQEASLIQGLDPLERAYSLYFPLYNGVNKIEIGVAKGSKFKPIAPRTTKPILFYGTSITQGACASRPGMCYSAILGRRLDVPVINLGFSGNGKMEPEVGALLCELDPSVYVINCLPNMSEPEVASRSVPLVEQLRKARPDTPIVMVEDRTYDNAWIRKSLQKGHRAKRAAYIRAFDTLVSKGVKNLHYVEGAELLGNDNEGTTDGSHPNDLGFMRLADCFEPVLKKVLVS